MIKINDECQACGMCLEVCPHDAIQIDVSGNGYNGAMIDQSKCKQCFKCITDIDCPGEAIQEEK